MTTEAASGGVAERPGSTAGAEMNNPVAVKLSEEELESLKKRNFARNRARIYDLNANRRQLLGDFGGVPWMRHNGRTAYLPGICGSVHSSKLEIKPVY